MFTSEQVAVWTKTAIHHLESLRGPFLSWDDPYPIPVRFCDGHAVHQSDLRELREHFLLAAEAVRNPMYGEDGHPLGVSSLSVFVSLYGIIANAQRIFY